MPINYHELVGDGGMDGARRKFESLVIQLAHLKHQAMAVAANPGDWGIDAFAGELDGVVAIWQSKFFLGPIGKPQIAQIRESFNAAVAAAAVHGYTVEAWTLCMATSFDGPALKWWTNWKRKQQKEKNVVIDLWSETEMEAMLLAREAAHISGHYFPVSMGVPPIPAQPEVLPLPDDHAYDAALFIKQLEEAGIAENESAKQQFFNHELLAREVADKADPDEINTLRAVDAEVRAMWEARFAGAQADPDGRKPELHLGVMQAIEDHHHASPPQRPPLSVVHRMGSMQQVVESGHAGWVEHFRAIAEAHRG